ncbi:MAG: methylenetetrahydrofolate reductase [Acidimicrobiaceae bacterium]|jgi:methylenetetrahydrofolate reductase (NADPH)|nr:methylenetetrahydrofolate reductase [Acidimicrobiaceae bacterium]MDQ1398197.1 methylenetetrahydrofolate reductase [Acidimicrobiaceae bacterium]
MAKIADLLAQGRTFSFEFFPPKSDAEQATLVKALYELQPLQPSFVSVTYRGGRSSRERTHDLVAGMLKTTSLTPMAHLICVAHTRLELAEIMVNFRKAGIENLMALGGDPPTDVGATEGELRHAIELVELARAIGGFSIGVAAHPIGHPRSPDLDTDRDHLCAKLSLADFAVTQFFFEFEHYLALVEQVSSRGMDKPILPGIMPVTTLASIPRMAQMGAAVPPDLVERLEGAAEGATEGGRDEAVRQAGIEAATELCEKLLAEGAPGLHFYTLNRSQATRQIYASLGLP